MTRLVIALLAALAVAAPAAEAATTSPASSRFYGMNVDGPLLDKRALPAEARRMRQAGASTVRWTIYWVRTQPYASFADVPADQRSRFADVGGIPTDWSRTDRVALAAARAGLRLLPVVISAPGWAKDFNQLFAPPSDPATYGRFMTAVAERYGARGSFWREHPDVRRAPVEGYQVWNEPAGLEGFGSDTLFWTPTEPDATKYVGVLRAAHAAVKAADPGAQVIVGGLYGKVWLTIPQLLAAGAGPYFDALAIHPYTKLPRDVVRLLERARTALDEGGQRSKDLIVTELSWPSARGRVDKPYTFDVGSRQQPARVREGLQRIATAARRLRVRGVFWYTWAARNVSSKDSFDYAGLNELRGSRVVAKPALRAYTDTVRALRRSLRR